MMKISIIIPTYNRAKMLGITIESFVHQNYPNDRYEIIIVDNNSNDATMEVIQQWQVKSPIPIVYILESRQGVHYARNTAAKLAKGEILYYTDDDMIADQNLLPEIIKVFKLDNKVASATGRVLPKWEIPPPNWVLELCNNSLLSLNDPKEDLIISNYISYVFSCHLAVKKEIFFESGGFNPENTAGEWIGDGETGLNIKIRKLGYKFAYNGNSLIYHMIPPTRMTQAYLNKRLANQGNCDSYTQFKENHYTKPQLIIKVLAHGKNTISHLVKSLIKLISNKPSWRLNLAKSFYFINRIKYDYRLIKDEKWRQFVLKDDWINE
jgi:glycosyltransferase involved in cell wall biosynthesis